MKSTVVITMAPKKLIRTASWSEKKVRMMSIPNQCVIHCLFKLTVRVERKYQLVTFSFAFVIFLNCISDLYGAANFP